MSDFDASSAMDEDERMDLALNSDLCSEFLDCWDESTKPLAKQNGSTGSCTPSQGEEQHQQQGWDTNIMMAGSDIFQPSLEAEREKKEETSAGHETPAELATQHINSSNTSGATTTEGNPTKLHPQAIQSSADCPPHVAALNSGNSTIGSIGANLSIFPFSLNALANPLFLQQANGMGVVGASSTGATSLPTGQASTGPLKSPPPSVSGSEETNGNRKSQPTTDNSVPPFFLFDAPLELRANFMHAQRAHGLPVLQDSNSYHYGMAVNGFHPSTMNLRLVDGRHGGSGNKREKNAKEQKRARQITKLIEQLRLKMEKDGWHVEFKSKFHTLASCSDYVKHLVKVNKEKEAAIEQAKQDLEAKRQRLEEDKAQQDPSDPESTTSDLTESSESAGAAGEKSSTETCQSSDDTTNKDGEKTKSRRIVSHESTVSSGTVESTDDNKSESLPGVRSVPANLAPCIVSDVTDRNQGVSSKSVTESQTSGSSSAPASQKAEVSHADVVIKQGEERHEAGLNYEEVFLRSNVPQLLATTAGRIVSWNDIFLRATGLNPAQVKRLTIFSLVQPQHLASLFEIVAASLRAGTERKNDGAKRTVEQTNYSAITLPCVTFYRPGGRRPLFITVTLLDDEDDRKRCLHCVLTDRPGTNGKMGSITPELLSELLRAPSCYASGESCLAAPPAKKRKTQAH